MALCVKEQAHYSPPWAGVSIIGIAGSSGSGKSTLSHAIISQMNLPWVCILSMVIMFFLIPISINPLMIMKKRIRFTSL